MTMSGKTKYIGGKMYNERKTAATITMKAGHSRYEITSFSFFSSSFCVLSSGRYELMMHRPNKVTDGIVAIDADMRKRRVPK